MFEGFNSRMWNNTSGVLLWMSHPAWPSVLWQTYTFDYETPAAYFGSKKACEPLHAQYNPLTRQVQIVNTTLNPADVRLSVCLYDVNGKLLNESKWEGKVDASSVLNTVDIDTEAYASSPVLLRLKYSDGSRNDYWLCKDASANKKLLASAAPSLQLVNAEKTDDKTYRFTIRNKGNNIYE